MQSNFHPNEWVQYTFQSQFVVQNQRDQDGARTFVVPDQPLKISSPESIISQGRNIIRGIQSRFVY